MPLVILESFLIGGYRTGDGLYKDLIIPGYLWSDKGSARTYEFLRISFNSASASFIYINTSYGSSMRCVKD